ncbi:AGAP005620-PA-like protein [Anopheles sinensis]|uniref:AGAP005620-PA-like protein n=1 Tax=Anopheles sinensis TaxID=74873 RepID=A0A084VCA5_ANOSI|nr:AGAP005620-PA-like protein [Anopheles sinensis]
MKLVWVLYGFFLICAPFLSAKPLQDGELWKQNIWVCANFLSDHLWLWNGSTRSSLYAQERHRIKRQFSLNLGATHEDGYGTDVNAEAIASLWKSTSGNTKLDGSATYTQHFGGMAGDGKPRISGLLSFSHNY